MECARHCPDAQSELSFYHNNYYILYVFQQLMLLRLLESNASQERATKMFLNTQIYTD